MRGCPGGGKVRHPNRRAAESLRRELQAKDGQPMWSYRCQNCGDWHLTREPKRTVPAAVERIWAL